VPRIQTCVCFAFAARSLAFAFLSVLWLSATSAAQTGPAPVFHDDFVPRQVPALNGVPSCDDGNTAIDGTQDACGVADTPTAGLGEYADTGDPVALHNGMVSYRVADLYVPGRGMDFELTRRYSSKYANVDGPLGLGWTHSYDVWIELQASMVILWNGNQRGDAYTGDKTVGFTAPRGVFTALTWDASLGTYTLRNRRGLKTVFDEVTVSGTAYGRLKSITNRDGNTLTFNYGSLLTAAGRSRLTSVRDTMKRTISFSYNSANRISRVTDFSGREVNYGYSSGELVNARTPKVLFACHAHLAPQGRIERYRYLANNNFHYLTDIVRPNQGQNNATGSAEAAVEFVYNFHPTNPNHWAHGWCIQQRLGDLAGTVGGIINYAYVAVDDLTPAGTLNAPKIERLQTTVTDRRGNVSKYVFNEYGHCLTLTEFTDPLDPGAAVFITTTTYDDTLGLSEGLVKSVEYPRGNKTEYAYQVGGDRWSQGNLIEIRHRAALVSNPDRVIAYTWDPVYQYVKSVTDERGFTREFLCEWMEGSAADPQPNVITAVAAELGLSYTDAQTLIGTNLVGVDLNGDGRNSTQASGKLVRLVEPDVDLQPSPFTSHPQSALEGASTPMVQEAVTTWTYNAYGQRTSLTDAEENVTVYLYWPESDPDGDGSNVNATADPVTGGYVRRVVEDTSLPFSDPFNSPGQLAGVSTRTLSSDIGRNSNTLPAPTNRTSDFKYTRFGYQSELIDARGVKHEYRRNDVGEIYLIVRGVSVADAATRNGGCDVASAEDLSGQAYAFTERICHDFNGNVTERRLQNVGNEPDAGGVAGLLESYSSFDILDNMISESHERDSVGGFETTAYIYDENENLEQVIYPAGNDLRLTYDARDQLVDSTRGAGTADQAIESRVYDANGNLIEFKDAGLSNRSTYFEYDEYDRLIKRTEPWHPSIPGTQTHWAYDPASNVEGVFVFGDLQGSSAPQLPNAPGTQLSATGIHYDARSRAFRVDRFARVGEVLVDGALISGDNTVSTRIEFDRLGRRTFVVEDDGQAHSVRYDGAHRPIKSIDPIGNEVEICWDDNSNPVKITEREKYPTGSFRNFETYSIFDSLNRRVSVTNNIGETHRFEYDSRDNLVFTTDPQAALGSQTINGNLVNHPGNARRFRHDGRGRLIREEYDLFVGGVGGASPVIDTTNPYNSDGIVRLLRSYDLNGRLTSRTDDNGNATSYAYDLLDRVTRETLADSTFYEYSYSSDSLLMAVQDPNGTVVQMGYDPNDRLAAVDVQIAAPSIVGTMKLRFEYDGLGRRTYSRDSLDSGLDATDWIVTRAYDSLGRVTRETQGELASYRTLSYAWREEAKRSQITYPSGLVINNTFDALDRIATINAGAAMVASYTYAGPGRVLERINGNGTVSRYHDGAFNDAAHYDGARRRTKLEHVTAGGTLLTGFEHEYDRVGNRKFERRLHDGSQGDNYVYDSLYRLVTFERLVPSADVGIPGQNGQQTKKDWKIDGVQNWRELITNGATTSTSVDAVNQYTAFGPATPTHDANGNMLVADSSSLPQVQLRYDFLNRLRSVSKLTGEQIEHDYDAEGRRVRTRTANVPSMPAVSEFVYDGWEEIEEHAKASAGGSFVLARRHVQGRQLDEPLRLENFSFYPGSGTYYFQQSTLGNVAAIADSTGVVVERYTFDAYGLPQFETPANAAKAVSESDFGNPYLFNARRYEPAVYPLYDFRARFLDPSRGRFVQRDPPGTWHDELNLGGAMAFVAANPGNLIDPLGLDAVSIALGAAAAGGTLAEIGAGVAAIATAPVTVWIIGGAAVIAGGYFVYQRWFADGPAGGSGGGSRGGSSAGTRGAPSPGSSAPAVPGTPSAPVPASPGAPSAPNTPQLDPSTVVVLAQSGLAQVALLTTAAAILGPAWAEMMMGKRKPYEEGRPGRHKQGREAREGKRDPDKGWKPRKPLKEPKKHHPGRDHRRFKCFLDSEEVGLNYYDILYPPDEN
jgi:RHS repeat-associated protein